MVTSIFILCGILGKIPRIVSSENSRRQMLMTGLDDDLAAMSKRMVIVHNLALVSAVNHYWKLADHDFCH